jgi:hypothetical protein
MILRGRLLVAPAATLAAAALWAAGAQAASIRGTLTNKTTGRPGEATLVRLLDVAKGMDQIATLTNVHGEFVFQNVPAVAMPPYLIQVQAAGVIYSERVPVPADQEVQVAVDVYDATDSMRDVSVDIFHVVFQRSGDHVEVAELIELQNNSTPPKAVWRDPGPVRLTVPADVHGEPEVTAGSGPMPLKLELVETDSAGVFAIPYAIKPGQTRLFVRYLMGYNDERLTWSSSLDLPAADVNVMVSPADIAVTGAGLAPAQGAAPMQGFAIYKGSALAAGQVFAVSLAGGMAVAASEQSGSAGSIQVRPNRFSQGAVPVMILAGLAALMLVGLAYGLSRTPAVAAVDGVSSRAAALEALGRLEDRYVSGEIDRSTFEHQREQLHERLLHPHAEPGSHGRPAHGRSKAARKG